MEKCETEKSQNSEQYEFLNEKIPQYISLVQKFDNQREKDTKEEFENFIEEASQDELEKYIEFTHQEKNIIEGQMLDKKKGKTKALKKKNKKIDRRLELLHQNTSPKK